VIIRLAQTRRCSFAEALVNVVAGYLLALVTQRLAYPLFGVHTTFAADSAIAAVFTLVSLARSYLIRRVFERLARPA
jgi:hypothetical protein